MPGLEEDAGTRGGYGRKPLNLTTSQSRSLLDLARRTIIQGLTAGGAAVELPAATPATATCPPAGCFVSLHELATHRLRGCVGRIEADHPVEQAVRSAAEWVLGDPRFSANPVTAAELHLLELEVSLLSALRPVSSPLDFEPATEGIVLTIAGRRGLFLPQVARETGWSREQLLSRLAVEKLDLPADAWTDGSASLEVFTTAILGPEPLLPDPSQP